MMETNPIGLYVHVPFCVRKCNYCDFCSCAASEEIKEKYVLALVDEIQEYRGKNIAVDTVFFGGGTPSILSAESFVRISRAINESFDLSMMREFTVECNPGTLDEEKLKAYRFVGVNRLSFGVQSIHENELKILGRIHSYEDFLRNYQAARSLGFDNISVDLMYGIPDQSIDSFKETLERVSSIGPDHISVYGLIIEEGTPFYEQRSELCIPSEDEECDMYGDCCAMLRNLGYEHYEISNYAKGGARCNHNMKYWRDEEYLGVGLAAHSYFNGKRFFNTDSFSEYFEKHRGKYRKEERAESGEDPFEYVMLSLRLSDGFSLEEYKKRFGTDFLKSRLDYVKKLVDSGLMRMDNGNIALTEKGFYVSNSILSELL